MLFEWDENKNIINQWKHQVSFKIASFVFDDPFLLTIPDNRYSYAEERWQSIGLSEGKLIYVAYTLRNDHEEESICIISARKASSHEARRYYYDHSNAG